jgi:metal-dependent amidase/aminoacylase/carboxypeptidase family protein
MTAIDGWTAVVLIGLDETRRWQEDFYRHLHEHPELSHQEHDTAAEVAKRLGSFGYEVHQGVGGTGVVGVLHNRGRTHGAVAGRHGRFAGQGAERAPVREHRHGEGSGR